MIILPDKKYIQAKFKNEQEIENVVIANSEHFFGPASIFIPKAKIRTADGFGTIPDGFAVDLASRVWYVVEVELSQHGVWTHIAPQVAKQLLATSRLQTRQLLVEILVGMCTEDTTVRDKFAEAKIKEIDIRKVVDDILCAPPIIGMPIDAVSTDLRQWAETLRNDVRLWVVKKYAEFGRSERVAYEIPEEYRPDLDTTDRNGEQESGIRAYDVSLTGLVNDGFLTDGEELTFAHKPRDGERKIYKGIVYSDGTITVLGQSYSSPS